jgi:4-hydroxy-tetrahydrodipicolinate synthase
MSKINGIYAATMSILNEDLSLNVAKTIKHSEQLINDGCHGVAIFGSTGQAQLISVSEKIKLLNELSSSKYKEKFIIGTGLNSLTETINLMKVSTTLSFKRFLIMPPAYYKYGHADVINFYSKIIEAVPDCEIVLYNFEKLCGYKFDIVTIQELVKKFPNKLLASKTAHIIFLKN